MLFQRMLSIKAKNIQVYRSFIRMIILDYSILNAQDHCDVRT